MPIDVYQENIVRSCLPHERVATFGKPFDYIGLFPYSKAVAGGILALEAALGKVSVWSYPPNLFYKSQSSPTHTPLSKESS